MQVPAFGWSRFDARPVGPPGDDDVLVGEVLHGRLDRAGWATVRDTLSEVRPLAAAAAQRAGGRAFWELPDEELSVLGEPGTVGAALRGIGRASGDHLGHVLAPLHRRHPALVPHVTRSTRRALFPHVEEGDSGVEAVVLRELRANAAAFAALEDAVATELGDARPTRLRLHDILLWLTTTLRLAHAVELGRRSGSTAPRRSGTAPGRRRPDPCDHPAGTTTDEPTGPLDRAGRRQSIGKPIRLPAVCAPARHTAAGDTRRPLLSACSWPVMGPIVGSISTSTSDYPGGVTVMCRVVTDRTFHWIHGGEVALSRCDPENRLGLTTPPSYRMEVREWHSRRP